MLKTITYEYPDVTFPSIDNLPTEDGIPMETPLHRAEMNLLIDSTHYHWRERTDYYVGGNMFIYFSEAQIRNQDYRGPDFYIVKDVDGAKERQAWIVWEEDGRYPDLIIELLSESTAELDKTVKKHLYERTFRTLEYYCYDITRQELMGWRLGSTGRYETITPNPEGRLWSELLQLWLGTWAGDFQKTAAVWLRFFDQSGQVVPTLAEAEAARADREATRADRAEKELGQLKEELTRLRGKD
jgi:Uma2 family endonuclease